MCNCAQLYSRVKFQNCVLVARAHAEHTGASPSRVGQSRHLENILARRCRGNACPAERPHHLKLVEGGRALSVAHGPAPAVNVGFHIQMIKSRFERGLVTWPESLGLRGFKALIPVVFWH